MRPFWANWNIPQSFGECLSYAQQIRFLAKHNEENEEKITEVDKKTLPEGGNPGEVLIKASHDDYDAEWAPGGGGGSTPVIDATATVDQTVGEASVTVTKSGTITNPQFAFEFTGIKGAKGDDGYAPTATVEKSGDESVITITDKNGTTSATVKDGAPGQNGVTPSVSATASVGSNTGTPSVQVTDTGEGNNHIFNFAFDGLKGESGGGSGTTDYEDLTNKPSINNVPLVGNKTLAELGYEDEIETVTQSQYDAMEQAGTLDPTKTYFISDAQSGPVLGSAASKNYTDRLSPDSTDLPEARAVYNAISSSLSSIFTPKGSIDFSDLTSDLLIPENVGNVYETNDAGVTDSNWVQTAGTTIPAQSNVAIISADRIRFNYQGASVFNLSDYQTKELDTPVTVGGIVRSTVQTAISAIVDVIDGMNTALSQLSSSLGSLTGRVVTLEGVKIKRKTVDIGGITINRGGASGIYYIDNIDLGLTDSEFIVSVTWNGSWSEDVILVPNTRKLGLTSTINGKVVPSGRSVNVYYI